MHNQNDTILVTGATGFLARHLIAQLLDAGYVVRGTLRNTGMSESLERSLSVLAETEHALDRFSWCETELLDDEGWDEAMKGVAAVMHVASPVVSAAPRDPAEIIRPAVEGTERVLSFMQKEGVERLILTSSVDSIGYGHRRKPGLQTYGPDDWTHLEGSAGRSACCVARTKAERSAWGMSASLGIALTTIHPGRMLGPVPDAYTSAGFDPLMLMLDGRVSALPRIGFNFVDVRDVAAIHIAALQGPSSIGKRVIAAGRYTTLQEVAAIVRKDYPSYPVPWAALPHWMSRLIALRNPAMRLVLPELGVQRNFDGQSGRELLGRNYIPVIRSVADTIESLIEAGLITR